MKNNILKLLAIVTVFIFMCLHPLGVCAQGQISRPSKNKANQSTNVYKKQGRKQSRGSVSLNPKKIHKVSEPDGYINGHGYVDLGLPSGLKWATCNVGASSPSEAGKYFAYGDETGQIFDLSYNFPSVNIINTNHDMAKYQMGSPWRMPSLEEFEELNTKCKWKIVEIKGTRGYLVIGPNMKSIFLPFAGFKDYDGKIYDNGGNFIRFEGLWGRYWSGNRCKGKWDGLGMYENQYNSAHYTNGCVQSSYKGLSVRAVLD